MLSMFNNYLPVAEKLLSYGFSSLNGIFTLKRHIYGGEFNLTVTVSAENKVDLKVTEANSDEEYFLFNVKSHSGAFVGALRTEAENILTDIRNSCFRLSVFKSRQSVKVINYAKQRYGSEPEYLWQKFPDNAVLRRADSKKWYGALLTVEISKLGLKGEERVEILDLRGDISKINGKTLFAGYHMNKNNWITLILDGRMPDEEIFSLIDKSYNSAKK